MSVMRSRRHVLTRAIAAVLLLGSASAQAFDVPVHIRITNSELRPLRAEVDGRSKGFSPKALEQIADANESVDFLRTGSAALFHPERHFTDESYTSSSQLLLDLRNEVIELVTGSSRDGKSARDRLGWALHTLQDFYAHSNWVERGNGSINHALGTAVMPNPSVASANCPDDPNVLGPSGGGTLTSGYFVGFTLNRAWVGCITTELPENKCFHGNYRPTCIGINKDLDAAGAAANGVPQNPLHPAAAQQARQATTVFVQGILDDLAGNDKALAALLDVRGSLGFVVDDTGSMGSSISGVVGAVNQIVSETSANPDSRPDNYLFVRFGDPDVGSPMITEDPNQLLSAVSALSPYGGGDCPELSQTALIRAVDAAASDSRIYLFTDATAKDSNIVNQVIARAQQKGTELNYGLTGSCSPIDPAYLRGADETGGQVFRVMPSEIPKLFAVIQPQLKGNLTTIAKRRVDLGAQGQEAILAPVDTEMSTIVAAVTVAENDVPASHRVRLFRPSGGQVASTDPGVQIVSLSTGTIVRVDDPEAGQWRVEVDGYGPFTATIQGNSPLDLARFDFVEPGGDIHGGFDAIQGQPTLGTESVAEATLIGPYASAQYGFIDGAGHELGSFELAKGFIGANPEHFLGNLTLPDVPFRVAVHGLDEGGNEYRREYPTLYRVQPLGISVDGPEVIDLVPGEEKELVFKVENLGAAASFNIDADDELGYVVDTTPAGFELGAGETREVTLTLRAPATATPGTTSEVVLTATRRDDREVYNSASVLISIASNRAPLCSTSVERVAVWPPNGSFHEINVDRYANVIDPDGDEVAVNVAMVTQDEPIGSAPDAQVSEGALKVRAERLGSGNGRVYEVHYVASDTKGGSCDGSFFVDVPHDQSGTNAVDDGQNYDSSP